MIIVLRVMLYVGGQDGVASMDVVGIAPQGPRAAILDHGSLGIGLII